MQSRFPESSDRPAVGALRSMALVSLLVAAVSCGEPGRTPPGGGPESASAPALGTPTAQEVAAGVFRGLSGIDEPVRLTDGRWEGPPFVEGGASGPVVQLMDRPRVEHDFDGDGRNEVVVIVVSTLGGTGVFMHLAVVENSPEGAVSRAVRHRSVEELWYVVSGRGEIWCEPASGSARILPLFPGTSLAIPARCAFQVRVDDEAPLEVVGVTLPPWPGDGEAELVAGRWITDMPAAGPE